MGWHDELANRFSGAVEFTERFAPRPEISHVIFDFDGTLSLIRQGWPDVMVPMFVELLPRLPGDTDESLWQLMWDDVMTLNGKQTIYQMIQFAERVQERGGEALDPLELKHEYLARLDRRIASRSEGLRNGEHQPDEFLVYGARDLLIRLRDLGMQMYLLSGTDEPFVKREAEWLGVHQFFGENIHGALDQYENFSKKMVIEKLLADEQLSGNHLLVFGDGYVEIEIGSNIDALTVAVASDEAHNGSGAMDAWKRQRLLGVGASIVIPDFRDAEALIGRIFDR